MNKNKLYYESNKISMNKNRLTKYHDNKNEALLIKMRENSKRIYELKKEQIKERNLARYYEILSYQILE